MRTWKLISGILSIVFAVFVAFQSSMAGLNNAIEQNGEVSGSAGLIVAILMLAGGIVSIAVKNKLKKGTNIAIVVIFGIAALLGFTNAGSYTDLIIWSVWCAICAVLALVAAIKVPKKTENNDREAE